MSVRGAEKALLVADFYVIEAKENSRLEVGSTVLESEEFPKTLLSC